MVRQSFLSSESSAHEDLYQPGTTSHNGQPLDNQGTHPFSNNGDETIATAGSPQLPLLPKDLQRFPSPIAIRTGFMSRYGSKIGPIFLRCGYVILRKSLPADGIVYEVSGDNVGYAVEVTIKLLWPQSRLSLMIFVTKELSYTSAISLSSKTSFLREVPRNAKAVTAVREGNTKILLELFKCKQVGPSDTLSNGSSLLHV